MIGGDQGRCGALEQKCDGLIYRLSIYRTMKRFGVIVVFDGWRSGWAREVQEKRDGILILYYSGSYPPVRAGVRASSLGSVTIVAHARDYACKAEEFHFLTGVFGATAPVLIQPASAAPMIGASGAVWGIVSAYLVLYPGARIKAMLPLGIFWTVMRLPAWFFLIFCIDWQILS